MKSLWSSIGALLVIFPVLESPALNAAEPPRAMGLPERERPNSVLVESNVNHLRDIRALTELQQQTILGNQTALAQQLTLAAKLNRQFSNSVASDWEAVRARQSLIKYVLSGGSAEALQKLLKEGGVPESDLALAMGVLAYAMGSRREALEQLSTVDPRSLNAGLGGHVALVKSMLMRDVDKRASIPFIDDARLLSPGTIVEEMALRTSIEFAIADGDRRRFERAALSYFIRFPKSLFADLVHSRVARIVALQGDAESPRGLQWLKDLGFALSADRRFRFYAEVAELMLRGGKFAATERSVKLAIDSGHPTEGTNVARLMAIDGAAKLFTRRRSESHRLLEAASRGQPSDETSELVASAYALAAIITARPPPVTTDTSSGGDGRSSVDAQLLPPNGTATVKTSHLHKSLKTKVSASLSFVDNLIGEVRN